MLEEKVPFWPTKDVDQWIATEVPYSEEEAYEKEDELPQI